MGGDQGLECTIPASLEFLDKHPGTELKLVGRQSEIRSCLSQLGCAENQRLSIVHATEVVEMDESPVNSLRRKKDSSMRVAINLIQQGDADACVSAGNTGALMATARFVLKTINGIDRPAICAALPRAVGYTYVLDLGANIDTPPDILLQFGVMGAQLIECLDHKTAPTVGLLNIGAEETKGHDTVKEAAAMLAASSLNYVGFIEGSSLFSGKADVVVTDGFTGNVALKTMEGTVGLAGHYLHRAFSRGWLARLQALLARPVLSQLAVEMDSRHYNGATLVGLNGIVIKSHGGADALAFLHAIDTAVVEVENQVPQQIGSLLEREAA